MTFCENPGTTSFLLTAPPPLKLSLTCQNNTRGLWILEYGCVAPPFEDSRKYRGAETLEGEQSVGDRWFVCSVSPPLKSFRQALDLFHHIRRQNPNISIAVAFSTVLCFLKLLLSYNRWGLRSAVPNMFQTYFEFLGFPDSCPMQLASDPPLQDLYDKDNDSMIVTV